MCCIHIPLPISNGRHDPRIVRSHLNHHTNALTSSLYPPRVRGPQDCLKPVPAACSHVPYTNDRSVPPFLTRSSPILADSRFHPFRLLLPAVTAGLSSFRSSNNSKTSLSVSPSAAPVSPLQDVAAILFLLGASSSMTSSTLRHLSLSFCFTFCNSSSFHLFAVSSSCSFCMR